MAELSLNDIALNKREGNVRVWKMYDEAADFKIRLSDFERALASLETSTSVFVDSLLPMLRAPLPRVWDSVEGGLAEPLRATISHEYPNLAGGDADLEGIKGTVLDLKRKVQLDVLRPVGQWRKSLESGKKRMADLDRLHNEVFRRSTKVNRRVRRAEKDFRSTLDIAGSGRATGIGASTRRGFSNLLFKCTHPTVAMNSAAGGNIELEQEVRQEERGTSLTAKQRKLAAVADSFHEQERLMYEQLSGLCRDASWLKSYEVSALCIIKEAFQTATSCLGATKQPIPSFGHERCSGIQHGDVADNVSLIADVPKHLYDRKERLNTLDRLKEASTKVMVAHYASSSPMEFHARDDIAGGETVPMVRRGASDKLMAPEDVNAV
ncbi:MAG: hypothetical protein WDW36_003967 [Sanguina aurantia]